MTLPGEKQFPNLFQEAQFAGFKLANRIKFGACCVSNFNDRDGFISPRELARTKVISETGCGMITNQGAYPDPLGEGKGYFSQIALYDDKFMPQFEEIAGYIHDAGAMAIQQILHAGRYGGIDIGYCVQPSTVPQTLPHFRPPREMSKEQIHECIRQHADACERAIRCGYDGVEVTSFMGYLLANFLSSFTNKRTDEYGGSVRNRGRFMVELIDEIKQTIGDKPLIIRLNGAELMDKWGCNSEDECFEQIQMAADAGVDMMSITVGWQEAPESSIGRDVAPGHWNRLAARCKKMLPDLPLAFGVRLPDPEMADKCIADGEFDFWEVCRPLLADPQMVHKARQGRLDEVRRCVGSLNCLSRLFRDLPYTCTMNPTLGHEYEPEYSITPAVTKKRVMVVGAGPAGLECAIAAHKRGHQVTVYEKSDRVGGALRGYAEHDLANKDDLRSVIAQYEVVIARLGIEVKLNTEPTPKMMRTLLHQYDVVVLATGASTDTGALPEAEDGAPVVDALDIAVNGAEVGNKVVVVGGNKVGLTVAESLSQRGHEVIIVERGKRVADDVSPTWKWRHKAWIEELGIESVTGVRVAALTGAGVTVMNGDGSERTIAADSIVLAGPRRPNQELYNDFLWMVDEIYMAGDVHAPRDLTQAIHEGYRLGCRI